jgi:hypothetical protein
MGLSLRASVKEFKWDINQIVRSHILTIQASIYEGENTGMLLPSKFLTAVSSASINRWLPNQRSSPPYSHCILKPESHSLEIPHINPPHSLFLTLNCSAQSQRRKRNSAFRCRSRYLTPIIAVLDLDLRPSVTIPFNPAPFLATVYLGEVTVVEGVVIVWGRAVVAEGCAWL